MFATDPHRSPKPTTRFCRRGPGKPAVGKATNHLFNLMKHLRAIGMFAEAEAVGTAIDWLIPNRWTPR